MKEATGNLFEQDVDAICITTNGSIKCDGRCVMGKGTALEAMKRKPQVAINLAQFIKLSGNNVHIIEGDERRVWLSFPVKHNWYDQADINLIERSCQQLVDMVNLHDWESVALPKPGCGAGRLTWNEVKPILEKYLDDRFTIVDL